MLVGTFAHRRALEQALVRRGLSVDSAPDAAAALSPATTDPFDVIAAVVPPRTQSLGEPLARIARMLPEAEWVLVTEGTPSAALERAAFICIDRRASLSLISGALVRAGESARRRRENASLRELLSDPDEPGLVGASASMQQVAALVKRFASRDGPVLIEGEKGTEKERVARAIHAGGARNDGPPRHRPIRRR